MGEVEVQQCQGAGCTKEAKLQCPTCLKQNISGSFFCSQVCFKENWVRIMWMCR
jgi:methionyl aminopeptidase